MFTRKDIIKLMVPLIIEQVLAVAIGMADTMMVASCGEAAVSGVSLVDSINVLLINIFSALATGGSIICAQYIGRDDHANANASAKQLIAATFLVSAVIMVICLFGNGFILSVIFKILSAGLILPSFCRRRSGRTIKSGRKPCSAKADALSVHD